MKKKARARKTVIFIITGCTVFGLVAAFLALRSPFFQRSAQDQLWLLGSGLILGGLVVFFVWLDA
jgi:hypothetical protein